ncbi:MAG: hypothetical protein Q4B16_08960 [Bacteroidia bacterium]|nr:hypothetical protein [Bacteroidia bacterium]
MDIDLLSKMVGELILDHDELSLPGLGTFVAEEVPATFSDRGYTVNPPYRKLSFYQRPENDHLLVDFYARSNGLSFDDASLIIARFLDEMKSVLKEKKVIVMPGLGRLRATRENNFFFVPDPDLDIYPDGFGLRAVSMKNHTESRAQLSEAVGRLSGMFFDSAAEETSSANTETVPPAEETASDRAEAEHPAEESSSANVDQAPAAAEAAPANAEPSLSAPETGEVEEAEKTEVVDNPGEVEKTGVVETPETGEVEKAEEKRKGRAGLAGGLKILLALALTLALALGVFLLLAHFAPEFIDSLLYTPEELEILNYPLS